MCLEGGALNPNNVLCTDQAPLLAFGALNPGSALNPRILNSGTTVYFWSVLLCVDIFPCANKKEV